MDNIKIFVGRSTLGGLKRNLVDLNMCTVVHHLWCSTVTVKILLCCGV
jgi:hypothetical protein